MAGHSPIYPAQPKARAGVDRWLDWTLSTLQPVDRPVFWALVRTPVEKRDMVAIQKDVDAEAVVWRIVEAQLATRRFIEGDQFTIADIALGAYARRWLGVEGVTKPKLPNLDRWFAQFAARRGFAQVHRAADDVETLARAAGHTGADAHRAADFHAGVGAFDLDEARAVLRAGIGRIRRFSGSSLPDVAALSDFWRRGCSAAAAMPTAAASGDQDQERFSHPAFYRALARSMPD